MEEFSNRNFNILKYKIQLISFPRIFVMILLLISSKEFQEKVTLVLRILDTFLLPYVHHSTDIAKYNGAIKVSSVSTN